MNMINRSTLDQFRKGTGFGQSDLRNTNTRSNDMAMWNYDNPAATNPGYATAGGLLSQSGFGPGQNTDYGNVGPQQPSVPAPQATALSGGSFMSNNGTGASGGPAGMSGPTFNSMYSQFQNSGRPAGMSFQHWVRGGQFQRPNNPFQQRPAPTNPADPRGGPHVTDPFTPPDGKPVVGPNPGNKLGSNDVYRNYVSPTFRGGI